MELSMANQLLGATELGLVYGLMVLGVYITFRILKIPDLTVDGSVVLGMSVTAVVTNHGFPILALLLAALAGMAAGTVTGFLQTKLKIPPILAGILTMSGLYSINLLIMNGSPNVSMLGTNTVFSMLINATGVSKHAGNINFQDFWKNKWLFLSFSFFFMANILFNFYGNQMVPNVNMFLSLRKLNAIALFLMDIYIGKKRFSCVTVSSIILIVGGAFVIGYDKLDSNLLGYLVVLGNNLMSLLYTKYSEVFRNITGFSNLKLLVYNAYICNPILLAGIFITGEYKRLIEYFSNNAEGIDAKYYGYYGTFFFLFLSAFFCFILTSSFFISNEKISSLMTNLLNNSRTIFISASLYFFDSSKNELNIRMIIGLTMSTVGAIFINAENLINNLIFNTGKKKEEKEEKEDQGTELLEVPDKENKDDKENKETENKS